MENVINRDNKPEQQQDEKLLLGVEEDLSFYMKKEVLKSKLLILWLASALEAHGGYFQYEKEYRANNQETKLFQ